MSRQPELGVCCSQNVQGPPRQHPDVQKKLDALFRARKVRHWSGGDGGVTAHLHVLLQLARLWCHLMQNAAGLSQFALALIKAGPSAQLPTHLHCCFSCLKLKASDLDQRCFELLHDSPVPLSISCLERFSARELKDVRNLSAFFMSKFRDVSVL